MKLKKLLAGFMTLAMLVTTLPATVLADEVVAKIGDTPYTTLTDAVTAANKATEAVTIELQAGVKLDKGITINNTNGASITIDGNENTITPKEDTTITGLIVTVRTDLTIVDTTISGFTTTSDIVNVYKGADLTLESCTFENNTSRTVVRTQSGYANTANMTDVTFKGNTAVDGVVYSGGSGGTYSIDECKFNENTCTVAAAPVALPGTVSITGSTFEKNETSSTWDYAASAAYCWGEDVTITGNTITGNTVNATGSTAAAALIVATGAKDIDLSDNTIDESNVVNTKETAEGDFTTAADAAIFVRDNGTGTVTISSGDIAGTVASANGAGISVTGGTFTDESVKDFVAGGSSVTVGGESYTGVAVAEINGTYFKTLAAAVAAAVAAAPAETRIELLGNVEGSGVKILGGTANIIIDLNGYTYTVVDPAVGSSGTESQGFHFKKGNRIKIMDGTLAVSESASEAQLLIQNYSDLTLEDVILDGTNLIGAKYTMSNNDGDVVITGETEIIAADNGVAFDVYDYENGGYDGVSVTFDENFTGAVYGPVEIDGSNPASLTAGLTIKGNGFFEFVPEVITEGSITIDGSVENGMAVYGGTFEEEVPSEYLKAEYIVETEEGISYFEEYEDAVEAAEEMGSGATVTTPDGEVVYVVPAPSTGSNGGSTSKSYKAEVSEDIENGSISLSRTKAKSGTEVTITATPDKGYVLDELKVLNSRGTEIDLEDNGDGTFTFKMPKGGVDIEASFEKGNGEPAVDEKEENVLILTIDQVIYQLNGSYEVNDVAPIIQGDRTFLPIRLIAEFLGATVTWSEADQSVTIVKDDTTIVIYIGQAFALVNGEPVQLDAPAFIANDRTYLPLRFVAENLGAVVTWDGTARTVTVIG